MPCDELEAHELAHAGVACRTHQELIDGLRNLVLWPRDCYYIRGHFGRGEIDLAIPLLFKVFDLVYSSNEMSMVQAIDDDGLGDEFRVLEHHICQSRDLSMMTEQ